jgi:hypothetical protein
MRITPVPMRIRIIALAALYCLVGCAGASNTTEPEAVAAPVTAARAVSYYVEFRARLSTEDLPGHTYLVYGPQDVSGHPVEAHIVGFYPVAGPLGFLVGTVAFPGEVGDGFVQDYMPLLDAYRVSITATQYDQLIRFVAEQKAHPPLYSLLGHNCNDWAAAAAAVIGLNAPLFRALPPDLFVKELRAANT